MGNTFKLGNYVNGIFQDSSNNIGIGAAPSGTYKLEVTGTAKVSSTLLVSGQTTFTSANNGKIFSSTGATTGYQYAEIVNTGGNLNIAVASSTGVIWGSGNGGAYNGTIGTANATDFVLATDNTGRMIIKSSGNVGIGTTAPSGQFQVQATNSGIVFDTATAYTPRIKAAGALSDLQIESVGNGGHLYLSAPGTTSIMTMTTNGAERMRIESGGRILIGTTTNNNLLIFPRTTNNVYVGNFDNDTISIATLLTNSGRLRVENLGTGVLYTNGAILTSTNPSDSRLKENITDISWGLNEILQLRPVSYNWINDKVNQGLQYGFIAQEVQEIMPDLVKEFATKDGEDDVIRLGLEKEGIYATLVKAIQELSAQNQDLKSRLDKAGL